MNRSHCASSWTHCQDITSHGQARLSGKLVYRKLKPRVMAFHLVQPYTDKPDRLLTAILVRSFETAAEAFAELDRLGERLHGFDILGDAIEMLVVDEQRRPVKRMNLN